MYFIKELIYRHNSLLRLVKVVNNLTYRNRYKKIIDERKELDLFNYQGIARPIKRYYTDYVPENNDKCMSICLKQYLGVNVNYSINAVIEHGLFFGDYVSNGERILRVPTIITFGSKRIKHLSNKKIGKKIIPIGPYIHYVKPYLSEMEFKKLKLELGRVLLVFPSHSVASEGVEAKYDVDEFGKEIDTIAKDFDSVLISLHFNDLALGPIYEQKGYRCVTSGHTNDASFMSRQRTLIELSDVTMSNGIGTHIGYCVYLNKPHYYFEQKVDYSQNKKIQERTQNWRNWDIYKEEVNEVAKAFGYYTTEITENQRNVVNKYWGTEYIRKPDELKSMLTFTKI